MSVARALFRSAVYFRRGHAMYGSMTLQFINFSSVMLLLAINLGVSPGTGVALAGGMLASYIAAMIILGKLDFKRGQFQEEIAITVRMNPLVKSQIELGMANVSVLMDVAKRLGIDTHELENAYTRYVETVRRLGALDGR